MATKKAETKKTETKKTTEKKPAKKTAEKKPKYEWKEGHPTKNGIYTCYVDGAVMPLKNTICSLSGKAKWATLDSRLALAKEIKWTGEPLNVEDL